MESVFCEGVTFFANFDSGNLARVNYVPQHESVKSAVFLHQNKFACLDIPDIEFNVWTRPDCGGTEFQNGNRTWFYFGVKGLPVGVVVKFNLVDINKQARMYSQGMAPVYRIVPNRTSWQRISDKPTYSNENDCFTLSFKFKTPDTRDSVIYFAFTYPFTYTDLLNSLIHIDSRFMEKNSRVKESIYYVRECICHSIEGRKVELLTISSYDNITQEREAKLKTLFTHSNVPRPFKFKNKQVVFMSARVHPGETPSSFVLNGFIDLLLNPDDPIAAALRRMYVFKFIPFLNPDGVARGHYRTDTRGVNLNRLYLHPDRDHHPSIYAARAVLRYHHFNYEELEDPALENVPGSSTSVERESQDSSALSSTSDNTRLTRKVSVMTLEDSQAQMYCHICAQVVGYMSDCLDKMKDEGTEEGKGTAAAASEIAAAAAAIGNGGLGGCNGRFICQRCRRSLAGTASAPAGAAAAAAEARPLSPPPPPQPEHSGLYLYIDMHGHASKKGIFMYGNHFTDPEQAVECMLLPKLLSLNNHNFHFTSCNFSERNMYIKDRRDGMSREGSGRVAVLKVTGLVKSYTLECNYNTGRMVNVLPPTIKENSKNVHVINAPPKFSPQVYEEFGRAIGASILDLTSSNPLSRVPNSEFRTLEGIREWLYVNGRISGFADSVPMTAKSRALQSQQQFAGVTASSNNTIGHTSSTNQAGATSSQALPPTRGRFSRSSVAKSRASMASRGAVKRPITKSRSKLLKEHASAPASKAAKEAKEAAGTAPVGGLEEQKKRMKEAFSDSRVVEQMKVREVRFVRDRDRKKMIAKYSDVGPNGREAGCGGSLIIAWDRSCVPRIVKRSSSLSHGRSHHHHSHFLLQQPPQPPPPQQQQRGQQEAEVRRYQQAATAKASGRAVAKSAQAHQPIQVPAQPLLQHHRSLDLAAKGGASFLRKSSQDSAAAKSGRLNSATKGRRPKGLPSRKMGSLDVPSKSDRLGRKRKK